MSNVQVVAGSSVEADDFWVDSGTTSTNEQFVDQTDIEGQLLLGIGQVAAIYSEYRFEAGDVTYRYIGQWQMNVDGGALGATTTASGSYDQIILERNGEFYASLDLDEARAVDFGSQSELDIAGLGTDALTNPLLSLLFGDGGELPVENLHLLATPGLTDLVEIGASDPPVVIGTDDPETISGGTGNDVIDAGGGNDVVRGGGGNDTIHGGDGNDVITGNAGNDSLYGDNGDDVLRGGPGRDRLWGGAGDDRIYGAGSNDKLRGGADSDLLVGGKGRDVLWGGAGADVFDFNSASHSSMSKASQDIIRDFTHRDTIDLANIDADRTDKGNQEFDFIGRQHFHEEAGELRFYRRASDTYIQGDVNGDGRSDFVIHLDDAIKLRADDFML